jgi:hypothetical protein
MSEQSYSDPESKVTARVDRELYDYVKEHFHQGQQTNLFRSIFTSLKMMIDAGKFGEVMDYMYGEEPLVLPNAKIQK